MSDILFLAVKDRAGKTKKATATSITTVTNVVTLTAGSGKDLWFGRASVSIRQNTFGTSTIRSCDVVLKANGVEVDRITVTLQDSNVSTPTAPKSIREFFNWSGFVTTGQSITIDVVSINGFYVSGTLICWEENSGESPFQASEFPSS